jgi:hypothetical protein
VTTAHTESSDDVDILHRAALRRHRAREIAAALDLSTRWSTIGTVVPVGAVAHGLVVSRDIDYEVFTAGPPTVRGGFHVLAELAEVPAVTGVRFTNALDTADHGLYWQVRCRDDDGDVWKIDIWTLPVDHPGPCAAWMVEPMRRVLTNDLRVAILRLKEARTTGQIPNIASIDLYRAVLDDGVRTEADLRAWAGDHYAPTLTHWRPG